MASLLERMDISPGEGNTGPIRNRGGRAASLPYSRPHKLGQSKADADTVWKHDLYAGPGKDLVSRIRLSDIPSTTALRASTSAPKVNVSGAAAALRRAVGHPSGNASKKGGNFGSLSIKGASAAGSNVVEVSGLLAGTSPADVETIFKRCGTILEATDTSAPGADVVSVRLKFKTSEEARLAVSDFDGVPADGRVLNVRVVGISSATLGGRLTNGGAGTGNGSTDVLMGGDDSFGESKLRSDELLNEPGAVILTRPPSRDNWQRGGRGRGGRRGGRGNRRGGRRGGGMDVD